MLKMTRKVASFLTLMYAMVDSKLWEVCFHRDCKKMDCVIQWRGIWDQKLQIIQTIKMGLTLWRGLCKTRAWRFFLLQSLEQLVINESERSNSRILEDLNRHAIMIK
jgi:hypothetical protein